MTDDDSLRPITERRITAVDFHDIARSYHKLDTRVAVLETRMDTQDHRLTEIERQIGELSKTTEEILTKLTAHIAAESTIQIRLMIGIGMTFLGVIAGRLGIQLPNFWQ